MRFARCCLFAATLLVLSTTLATGAEEPNQVDVFVSGQEGYHTFRIPALLRTQAGTLLAFCEGRKTGRGDHGDLDLVMKRSDDGGKTWGDLTLIYEEGGDAKITIGNPCPVQDERTGTIWLPLCRDNDDVLMMHSTDDGRTWSEPVDITKQVKLPNWGWYATGPGVGIQLKRGSHAGRLVIPCDHGEKYKGQRVKMSHCFYSDDGGKSWQLGESVSPHTDECQVVELPDGKLMINMRNYWAKTGGEKEKGSKRAVAYSDDGGETWSDLEFDSTLIEPVCQASLITGVPDSESSSYPLFFSNPASKNKRHRMTVRMSPPGSDEWPISRTLYKGSAAYSSLAALSEDRIGCLYERDDYGRITFADISIDWLKEGDDK